MDEDAEHYWTTSRPIAFDWDAGVTGLDEGGYSTEILKTSGSTTDFGLGASTIKLTASEEDDMTNYFKALDAVQQNRLRQTAIVSLSPKAAIEKMLRGQWIPLEPFKALEDKLALLQLAVESHDGDIITRVISFLKDSLKEQLFYVHLRDPLVVNHYLKTIKRPGDKSDTLALLGRDEELLSHELIRAVTGSRDTGRVRNLQKCATLSGGSGGADPLWRRLISEHITLLERQLPIEQADRLSLGSGIGSSLSAFSLSNPVHKVSGADSAPAPPPPRLVGESLLSTLHYCVLYHYTAQDTHFHSPRSLLSTFRITERQYVWTVLRALAKSRSWPEIDALFQTKSWYGGTKVRAIIPWSSVVSVLKSNGASSTTTEKYEILARGEE